MSPRFANPLTGELYPEGSVVDLSSSDEDVIYEEPTRVDLDGDGNEYNSPSMQKKALTAKRDSIDEAALRACRRKSGRFANTQERSDWHKITQNGLGATPDKIVYMEWIKFKINQYKEMNSKPGVTRDFQQLMAGIRSEVMRDDWIGKNRDRILAERKAAITHAREDEIFEG